MCSMPSSQPNRPSRLSINPAHDRGGSTGPTKPGLISQQRGGVFFFLFGSVFARESNGGAHDAPQDWKPIQTMKQIIPAQIPCVYTFDLIIMPDFDPPVCSAVLFIDVNSGGHYPSGSAAESTV